MPRFMLPNRCSALAKVIWNFQFTAVQARAADTPTMLQYCSKVTAIARKELRMPQALSSAAVAPVRGVATRALSQPGPFPGQAFAALILHCR